METKLAPYSECNAVCPSSPCLDWNEMPRSDGRSDVSDVMMIKMIKMNADSRRRKGTGRDRGRRRGPGCREGPNVVVWRDGIMSSRMDVVLHRARSDSETYRTVGGVIREVPGICLPAVRAQERSVLDNYTVQAGDCGPCFVDNGNVHHLQRPTPKHQTQCNRHPSNHDETALCFVT